MRLVSIAMLLLAFAGQAQAWWNNPYSSIPSRTGYWPSVWPAYVPPQYGNVPFGGWNVKGSMNQRGDTHFVFEYHGNIYDMPFGNRYGYPPAYQAYPGFRPNQNIMNGWRR